MDVVRTVGTAERTMDAWEVMERVHDWADAVVPSPEDRATLNEIAYLAGNMSASANRHLAVYRAEPADNRRAERSRAIATHGDSMVRLVLRYVSALLNATTPSTSRDTMVVDLLQATERIAEHTHLGRIVMGD